MRERNMVVGVFILVLLSVGTAFFASCASSPESRSTGQAVDDAAITTKVKAAFASDPAVSAFQVRVQTYNGVVQLSGFVNEPEMKVRAGQVASAVDGVEKVDNDIVVKDAG